MARDQRNGGVTRVREALDECAARMRRGEGLDSCLNAYLEYADELRPMLEALVALRCDLPRTPAPPADLSRGRERMLAAASVMQASEDTGRAQDLTVAAALDTALDQIRAGDSLERIVAESGPQPQLASELASLLQAHCAIRADVVPPPMPNGRLEAGKRRFLSAAAVMAESCAVESDAATDAVSFSSLNDALDVALSRLREGEPLDAVLSEHSSDPERARSIRELLQTAVIIKHDAVSPPPMNGSSELGRTHLVAAARVAAEAARNGDVDTAVADALDSALLHVRNGVSIDEALAACAGGTSIESAVRGLLSAAEAVHADVVAPPVMNGALERGRRLLLAAAVVAHEAEFRSRSVESSQEDALDQALQRIREGASIEESVAAASAASALDPEELRRMVLAAESLRWEVVPVPLRSLDAGRARLLEVAAKSRDLRASAVPTRSLDTLAAKRTLVQSLAVFIGGGIASRRPRVAAFTMAALAVFMLGNAALTPVSARALPGDGLYIHKMILRSAKLIVSAVNPGWHQRIRAEISAETIDEIQALQELAREVEVRLEGELHDFEEHTADGDIQRHGMLQIVQIGDDGVAETVALAWRQPPTVFELPDGYETLGEVPAGTALALHVRTGALSPMALIVRTRGLEPLVPHAGTATSALPTQEQETPETETATPPPTPTDAPSPTATDPSTATPVASPTATTSPTLPAATDEPMGRDKPQWDELLGVIIGPETVDSTGNMQVRRRSTLDIDGPSTDGWVDVRVEIGAARASASGGKGAELWERLEVGRTVKLRGRYENKERTVFVANRLLDVSSGCVSVTAVGEVASFIAGAELVLANGTRFELNGDEKIEGELRPGVAVSIEYESCAPLPDIVRRISVETPVVMPEFFSGEVTAIIDGRSFAINDASRARLFIVHYDPTRVVGEASVIEVGQRVRFEGILTDPIAGVIDVDGTVVVTGAAPTPEPPTETPPPLPTPTDVVPTPTPMSEKAAPVPTSMPEPSEVPPPTGEGKHEGRERSGR